ncbi:MAG: hypothetical protein ACJAV1_001532, partial [Paraglaciecola sp.]
WRYSCPTFLRQTFVEWAGFSIRYSFWAKAYYEQQKSKGKPHKTKLDTQSNQAPHHSQINKQEVMGMF